MRLYWFAKGGGVAIAGPFRTQADAAKSLRLIAPDGDLFPPDAFVWPEECRMLESKKKK